MGKTQRGCLVLLGIIVFLGACAWLTFGVLPGAGSAPSLPVIAVPGEPYYTWFTFFGLFPVTNTWVHTLTVSLILLIVVAIGWRVSKGWTKEVPGRFQALLELLGEFVYGQTKNFAGLTPLSRNWLFPLAASIFVFLLVANLSKLIPGFETIGIMHCAGHNDVENGINITAGHPSVGNQLWVDAPLKSAYTADETDYHACEEWKEGHVTAPTSAELAAAADHLREEEETIRLASFTDTEESTAIEEARLHAAEEVWPHAAVGLPADALEQGVVPYLQVVTPYFRGATTDLNLPLALALIVFVAIQVFGVAAQGPNYFQKFVNLSALGNLGKKPLGAIDFVVGLLEIISELGKIVSLTFRLFGNLFAGGILLAVMSFLVGLILPVVFMGLELVVASIQAYVFAILTIVFSAQAMEGHHGDDEHHDEAHDHA
ncbi:MAG: F0F1 ATP synthase subunit A [Anaerolineae bacterium]|nr:F0F1 ATP synthase subunit A [Anaerolineae bacterium]